MVQWTGLGRLWCRCISAHASPSLLPSRPYVSRKLWGKTRTKLVQAQERLHRSKPCVHSSCKATKCKHMSIGLLCRRMHWNCSTNPLFIGISPPSLPWRRIILLPPTNTNWFPGAICLSFFHLSSLADTSNMYRLAKKEEIHCVEYIRGNIDVTLPHKSLRTTASPLSSFLSEERITYQDIYQRPKRHDNPQSISSRAYSLVWRTLCTRRREDDATRNQNRTRLTRRRQRDDPGTTLAWPAKLCYWQGRTRRRLHGNYTKYDQKRQSENNDRRLSLLLCLIRARRRWGTQKAYKYHEISSSPLIACIRIETRFFQALTLYQTKAHSNSTTLLWFIEPLSRVHDIESSIGKGTKAKHMRGLSEAKPYF